MLATIIMTAFLYLDYRDSERDLELAQPSWSRSVSLDANDGLVKNSFSFSFVDEARPLSSYREVVDYQMQVISSGYRLL
jgi:hypothetical protein